MKFPQSAFEQILSVPAQDIKISFLGFENVGWSDFLLNPRRLRGSDFLMRWSQGVWSEERLIDAVNNTGTFYAVPYGPSSTAPDSDVREFELYFERLESAGLKNMKRPDLLVFPQSQRAEVQLLISELGGVGELPFTPEDNVYLRDLLDRAIVAVECENSLWKAKQMPQYNAPLKPQKRLGGKAGLSKSAVLPTVIVKEEDRHRLLAWQHVNRVPIHVWHVFYDLAFGISLDGIHELIQQGLIEPSEQVFQAPGGATTRKILYKIYHHYAYSLGEAREDPTLVADHILDANGHILPFVRFEGGQLEISSEALQMLNTLAERRQT